MLVVTTDTQQCCSELPNSYRNQGFDGTVYFIFQPAEEGEAGARAMIDDGLFTKFNIDSIFAIHNWPHLKSGIIKTRKGQLWLVLTHSNLQ